MEWKLYHWIRNWRSFHGLFSIRYIENQSRNWIPKLSISKIGLGWNKPMGKSSKFDRSRLQQCTCQHSSLFTWMNQQKCDPDGLPCFNLSRNKFNPSVDNVNRRSHMSNKSLDYSGHVFRLFDILWHLQSDSCSQKHSIFSSFDCQERLYQRHLIWKPTFDPVNR